MKSGEKCAYLEPDTKNFILFRDSSVSDHLLSQT